MARLEVNIDGDAKGVSSAFNQAQNAVSSATDKINKGLKVSKAEIEAWDAAARKASQQSSGIIDPKLAEDAAAQAKKLRQANQDLSQTNGRLEGSFKGINNSTLEFTRIIQDAPYGIQGVANNIQQLGTSLSYEAKNAGSFGAALKNSFTSLLNPMGLMMVGISAVTVGFQLYSDRSKKAKKDTDDIKQSFDEYVKTLKGVQAASLQGEADAQKSIARLNILKSAIDDTSLSTQNRADAIKSLQSEFPSYFGNLTKEEILTGKGEEAYRKLTASLIATAKAGAYKNKIAENSIKMLDTESRAMAEQIKMQNANDVIKRLRKNMDTSALGSVTGGSSAAEYKLIEQQEKIITAAAVETKRLSDERTIAVEENAKYESEITKEIINGADILKTTVGIRKEGTKAIEGQIGSLKRLNDEKSKIEERISLAVNSEQVEKASKELIQVNLEIFKLTSKQHEIQMKVARDKFGVPASDIQAELNTALTGKVDFGTVRGGEAKEADKTIADRYAKERKKAEEWLELKQKLDLKRITEENKTETEFSRSMSSSINRAGREFYGTLSSFNNQVDRSFENLFATFTGGVSNALNEIFLTTLTDGLKDGIKKGTDDLESKLKNKLNNVVAGIGVAGGVISGLTSKTSSLGQGIGGGASGFASGAKIGSILGPVGSVIGGAIGGLTGLLSGIFGAGKAKKQEKLQEQQLAEQQRQTKLMERQNSLTWGSNIVGRHVEGLGIVSGLDFSATGKLIATVKGQDLEISLDKTSKNNKRGVSW